MLSRTDASLAAANAALSAGSARVDLVLVAEMVDQGAKVLDVGCGDGELLRLLGEIRGVDGRGIELSREGVNECVAKGLAVIQGDADTDLADYPDDAFDYVILSQTLQATRHPRVVLLFSHRHSIDTLRQLLPPHGAREILPRGSVRKRDHAILMAAPLTRAGKAFIEDATRKTPADLMWSTDHI